jgi:hypothetical protein
MSAFIGGRRYTTHTSALLAHGDTATGPAWLPGRKVTFVFRGKDGRYFAQYRIYPEAGQNVHTDRYWIEPLTELDAILLYWELDRKVVEYAAAFTPPAAGT